MSSVSSNMSKRIISFDMGSRNLAYCYVEAPYYIKAWGMIDLGKHESHTAATNLLKILENEHRWMRESAADVVIESQPKKGVCKTLSHCLQIYFGLADIDDDRDGGQRTVHFMSAHNKLKYDTDVYDTIRPQTDKDRKRVTMTVTRMLLGEQPDAEKFKQFYEKHNYKQQTDLADAFVQGCRELQLTTQKGNKRKRTAHRPSHNDGHDFCVADSGDEEEEEESLESGEEPKVVTNQGWRIGNRNKIDFV